MTTPKVTPKGTNPSKTEPKPSTDRAPSFEPKIKNEPKPGIEPRESKSRSTASNNRRAEPKKSEPKKELGQEKPEENDLAQEVVEALVERGKRAGVLSYEELMEFCDRNHLTED